jgi:hypothetical protein
MKLPGVISLRKDLPVCAMPNGRLAARGLHDVEEVDEDALRRLGPQVVQPLLVLHRAQIGLEQPAELTRLGEGALGAAARAVDVGEALGRQPAVLRFVGLFEVVGAVALVTRLALGQRIGERVDVPGRDPHVARQDDRGVDAYDVLAPLHHRLPPLAADVLLELDTERPVVPRRPRATVDLAGLVDESTALAEADQGVDDVGGHSDLHPAGGR